MRDNDNTYVTNYYYLTALKFIRALNLSFKFVFLFFIRITHIVFASLSLSLNYSYHSQIKKDKTNDSVLFARIEFYLNDGPNNIVDRMCSCELMA